MAIRPIRYTSQDFDKYIGGLITDWKDALERKSEWYSLDGEERATYTEDWLSNSDIHQLLADYVAEHKLTEDQQAQWAKLNKLVAEHTKDLEEMGYRVRIPKEPKGREREVA